MVFSITHHLKGLCPINVAILLLLYTFSEVLIKLDTSMNSLDRIASITQHFWISLTQGLIRGIHIFRGWGGAYKYVLTLKALYYLDSEKLVC